MGRTVAYLAAAQLVLLGFVATKLTSIEQALENTELDSPLVVEQATARAGHEAQAAATPERHDWESSLRRIIREEIGSVDKVHRIESNPVGQVASVGSSSRPHDPARLVAVNRQLDYFISIGQISPAEMSALQQEIAGLDEGGRRQILGKLTGAMNRGVLKGQL